MIWTVDGHIGRRKRNALRRSKRSVSTDFDRLCSESGGQLIVASKTEIQEVVKVVEISLRSSEVTIAQRDCLGTTLSTDIPVDVTMSNMVIMVSSSGAISSVEIKDPTDNIIVPVASGSDDDVILVTDTSTVKLYSIVAPRAGLWNVVFNAAGKCSIKVTADSTTDFRYQFVEEVFYTMGYKRLDGRPKKGVENILVVETIGASALTGMTNVTALVFVRLDGTEIARLNLTALVEFSEYEARSILPEEAFRVALEGLDNGGNIIRRLDTSVIRTAQSEISVNESSVLRAGESLDVPITVTNNGPQSIYTLTIQDDNNLFNSLTPKSLDLAFNESKTAVATFIAPVDIPMGQVSSVSVTAINAEGDDSNFVVFRLSTLAKDIDSTPPYCTIIKTLGNCTYSLNTGTPCALDKWSLEFEAGDDTGLFSVKPSETHTNATFVWNYDDSDQLSGTGTYSSDCCLSAITITASDNVGNAARCSVAYEADPIETTTESSSAVTLAISFKMALFLIVMIFIFH